MPPCYPLSLFMGLLTCGTEHGVMEAGKACDGIAGHGQRANRALACLQSANFLRAVPSRSPHERGSGGRERGRLTSTELS